MATLQLADKGADFFNPQKDSPADLYVFVPSNEQDGTGVWVREDYFDNVPDDQYIQIMQALAPYQPGQMSGIFSNIKQKIGGFVERRQERKAANQAVRTAKDASKIARYERRAAGDTFGSKIAGVFQNITGGGEAADTSGLPMDTRAFDIGYTDAPPKKWYENPVVIVGGVAALGLLGYVLTRKKK